MTIRYFVCKTCGRGIAAYDHPKYCYVDRMDTIEEVGEEGSQKMGLFFGLPVVIVDSEYMCEFPGDILYDPFTGEGIVEEIRGYTLDYFQLGVMKDVRSD